MTTTKNFFYKFSGKQSTIAFVSSLQPTITNQEVLLRAISNYQPLQQRINIDRHFLCLTDIFFGFDFITVLYKTPETMRNV